MIQNIDFLPASYHKTQKRRQKRNWNRFIVVTFLVLVALGWIAQWRNESKLEQERDKLLADANRLTSQLRSADDVQKQIAKLDLQADLVTHLNMQTQLSQLLSTLAQARPRYVRLLDVQTKFEKLELLTSPSARKAKPKTQPDKNADPIEADLKRLRTQAAEQAIFVTLRGVAPDDLAVSSFLAALKETDYFRSIVLLYSDEYRFGEFQLRNFTVRLRLRPLGDVETDDRTETIAARPPQGGRPLRKSGTRSVRYPL